MTTPTRTPGQLGRKPNEGRPRIRLSAMHKPPAYQPPPTVDRYSAVVAATWGMDGNDTVGDCTCADVDHEVKSVQVAAGNPEVPSTKAQVLAAYSAITGYNPADPSTDQGAEMQAVRDYWRSTGFTLGVQVHKVLLFAELDIVDTSVAQWALDQLGAVGVGVNLPNSAMSQFNAGQPWDVVADDGGIDGGHAVALVGYDAAGPVFVTWGAVQHATWAWWARYVEEAWVVLTEDFVNAHTGDDPLGGTLYQLGQQFTSLTGQPNPVPAPGPSPSPQPVPPSPSPTPAASSVTLPADWRTQIELASIGAPSVAAAVEHLLEEWSHPTPDTDPADLQLVATAGAWANEEHLTHSARAVAQAIRSWRAKKGI